MCVSACKQEIIYRQKQKYSKTKERKQQTNTRNEIKVSDQNYFRCFVSFRFVIKIISNRQQQQGKNKKKRKKKLGPKLLFHTHTNTHTFKQRREIILLSTERISKNTSKKK